jgi:pimeloyl-ACP methyl ester carboxylesterase
MTAREIELNTPNLRLAARGWGEPGGERVLALHGWLDNAASFDALAPLMDNVELVALDLPGHGRSAHRPRGAWYHFVDYGTDVIAAADALGWSEFTLLGHSLGGALASVLAAALPQRVRELWLIEALGPISTAPAQAPALLGKALLEREQLREKSLRVFPNLDLAVAARRQANGLSEFAARALVERGARAVEGGFVWSSDPRLTLTSAIRLSEEQVQAYIAAIACPTLLVLADPPAPFVDQALMRARMGLVRGMRCVTLPGTHHLHLEDPAPVAAAIAAFRARA